MVIYGIAASVALLAALGLTPVARHLGRRLGMIDQPNARKVHDVAVPRMGGVAIYLAFLVGTAVTVLLSRSLGIDVSWERQGIVMLGAGLAVFLTGVLDDLYDLPSRYKLLVLLAAAAAVCGTGVTIQPFHMHEWGRWAWLLSWSITMLWIVSVSTAINFIDGLDGLAGGIVALAAGVLLLWAGGLPGSTGSMIYTAALVGALLGFLWYNRYPANIFMGDGGSMFIGFTVACISVLAVKQLGTARGLMMPMLALVVPLADFVLTILRRKFVQRRSIFAAERGHIHHRLLDIGLHHPHAVWLLYAVSVTAVAIGLVALTAHGTATFGILGLIIPLIYGLFRMSGSTRARGMLMAVRKTLGRDREARSYREAAERIQLELAKVDSFGLWWETICRAAEDLDFISLQLTLTNRNGKPRTLRWDYPNPKWREVGPPLSFRVPVQQRRINDSPEMHIAVAQVSSLESAAQRAASFTRLLEEFGLDRIQNHKPESGQEAENADRVHRLSTDTRVAAPKPPKPVLEGLKVAVVHDFLYTYAGAERVLEQILELLPQADLFALFDFLPEGERGFIGNREVKTTFIQRMPLARKKHRGYLPLMPLAIEQLDMSGYDLVVSSSYLAAKGVITGPGQCHICYCHSPVRYAWDLQHQYLNESNLGFGPKGLLARSILHYIRSWDVRTSGSVDRFIANSNFVKQRIEKLYRRDSVVVNPPVATHEFPYSSEKEEFYVTASRLVGYKQMDVLVEAFNRMPHRRLVVIGDGPEREHLESIAGPNVRIAGHQPFDRLKTYLALGRAFVFAAEEDFGIVPVEAMACGTPVIAYGRGGALESVVEGRTGLFFEEQTPESVIEAVERFESHSGWDHKAIARHAADFGHEIFHASMRRTLAETWSEFARLHRGCPLPEAPDTGVGADRRTEEEHRPGAHASASGVYRGASTNP